MGAILSSTTHRTHSCISSVVLLALIESLPLEYLQPATNSKSHSQPSSIYAGIDSIMSTSYGTKPQYWFSLVSCQNICHFLNL
ncbi:hypothetical protein N7532_008885 [Penicillium argentinense]|uniref:Uncharacterized protein n=1 Tax=Penicillium argentinense TaxID=1131581 RepID=A0A9W9EYI5_9EURO|nr:uncharacterized protein N7532_008885 [Penicillium argentinense]KAJ5090201.1 hypothetical protein N7532_008885 [Penicillium argentinense]